MRPHQSIFSKASLGRVCRRQTRWVLIFLVTLIIAFPQVLASESSPIRVEEVSDRNYLAKVLELIDGARHSIDVSMYQILLPGGDTEHPVSKILNALVRAQGRGVRVRVLLNRHLDYLPGETAPLARSVAATEYLASAGIEVVFASPARRLHDKVIVIDGRWVVDGSMNWSETALWSNWESATLIDSQEYAAKKLARIRAIPLSSEKTLDSLGDEGELLEVPEALVQEKKYFPDLLRRKDERIFEFYLWLLKESHIRKMETFVLTDETLFRVFRLDPEQTQKAKRREAVRLLKKIAKRGLIGLDIPTAGADAEVTLRKPSSGSHPKLTVPLVYFDYGLPEKLSLAGEFVYLLSRLEMTQSPSSPWWWRPQEDLTELYHLHHTTLAKGMLELQRENMIEIVRDDAPEGARHSDRLVNRYRTNRLVDPDAGAKQKEQLIQKFGRENFERAQHFADVMDEPNDFAVIATILNWMGIYPAAHLEAAFDQVSRYERNNPRRSLYYVAGILEGKEEEANQADPSPVIARKHTRR